MEEFCQVIGVDNEFICTLEGRRPSVSKHQVRISRRYRFVQSGKGIRSTRQRRQGAVEWLSLCRAYLPCLRHMKHLQMGVTTMLVRWVHLRGHPQRARIRTSTLSRYVHDGSIEGGGQYMGVEDALIESSFYPQGREDALASPEAVTNTFR